MSGNNLTCVCCGAPINRATMRCEYCGTEYEIKDDNPIVRIETFQNPIKTYTAVQTFSEYDLSLGGEELVGFAIRRLAQSMMPSIIEAMEIQAERNSREQSVVLRGRLKTVIPKYSANPISIARMVRE